MTVQTCANSDYRVTGPFNQTLFLGCSVSRFNLSIGWGSDSSQANLTLIQDTSFHAKSQKYNSVDTNITSLLNSSNRGISTTLITDKNDPNKNLHKNLAKSINENIPAGQKISWPAFSNAAPKAYTDPDPGFLALIRDGDPAYDIIGCPVYFKFLPKIEFGGYVHSWKAAGSQGGSPIFDVELRSFSSLLNNTYLIIDNYIGSISSVIPGIGKNILPNNLEKIAVPSLDENNNDYNATLAEGNIANVFNIYGHIVNAQGFESLGWFDATSSNTFAQPNITNSPIKTENGLSAYTIYQYLINNLHTKSKFSPYGGILGRSPCRMDNGVHVDTATTPVGPWTSDSGTQWTLRDLGLCSSKICVDNQYHSLFKLDISEIPVPPVDLYIPGNHITISEFIRTICDGVGVDYYVSFELDPSEQFSGIIKIKTISRRSQPSRNVVKNLVYNLLGNTAGTPDAKYSSFRYGEEFNDSPVRTMYVGGKQKRLLQVLSSHLATRQTTLVYDPYRGSFMPVLNSTDNSIRVPDHNSTRYKQYNIKSGAIVAQTNTSDVFENIDRLGSGYDILQGNYFKAETVAVPTNTNNHPLYMDLICPYFGNHGEKYLDQGSGDKRQEARTATTLRKVYWDKQLHQLKIVFIANDITRLLSVAYTDISEIVVTENEIRAAGAGFESWFAYCFDNMYMPDIVTKVAQKYFTQTYPNAGTDFFHALGVIHWNSLNKTKDSQTAAFNPSAIRMENANAYIKSFYNDLQKIHSFFQDIYNEYYGKQYMIKAPKIKFYRDPYNNKLYQNWEISEDGAWEEPGNFIDDTMVVGSSLADFFSDDQGKIGTILGFNANGEKSTRDEWINSNISLNNNMAAINFKEFSKYSDFLKPTSEAFPEPTRFFYFPLEHSMSPDEYTYVKYINPVAVRTGIKYSPINSYPNVKFTTSHGDQIPDNWTYKMYVKGNTKKDIVFAQGDVFPRIIVSCPQVNIGGGKNECENSLVYTMLHDAILRKNYNQGINPASPTLSNMALAWILSSPLNKIIYNDPNNVSVNNVSENIPIKPKAACPAFAAIPVQFNLSTYGPWINHPGLISVDIFAEANGNVEMAKNLANNLIGGVKYQDEPELVPWNYGGTDNLDLSVMTRITEDINYQQITEQGEIGVIGFILSNTQNGNYSVGDVISDQLGNSGPIINNMTLDIGENGITANYNIRTFTRKLGFFNKDASDRFKLIGLENFKRKKEINNRINSSLASIKQNLFPSSNNDSSAIPKALRWSPAGLLTGATTIHMHQNSSVQNIYNYDYSPGWFMLPHGNISLNPVDLPRYLSNVGIQEAQEAVRELKDDYHRKSMMSLDGLLSPISFYPTHYGSTYSITKYPRSKCPVCLGKGQYDFQYIDTDKLPTSQNNTPSANQINNAKLKKTVECSFCEKDEDKQYKLGFSASPKETLPPYIIASGNDLEIISQNNLNNSDSLNKNTIINYSTLNPVLLIGGEFGCVQNRQSGDFSAHCIDTVANGLTVPQGEDSLKIAYSKNINHSLSPEDLNFKRFCDLNNIKPEPFQQNPKYPNPNNIPANNMRFFGLRGPLMVHGWGYDLEGYPVPNASGEPKLNANGTIQKDDKGNILYKNQTQNEDGSWTKPYKEHTFYKGWGQMPGTWPVGPVDLRWDDNAKVWTVGANYKNVWIKIENDLVDNQPSRGQVVSDLDNNPLPEGLRKLVFVKDNLGINPAPRGAQIYCKYNSDNGFYEPIYNRPFITSGIIVSDSAADIYKAYGNEPSDSYRTTYNNPLNLNISQGNIGIFVYISKEWVLQST